VYAFMRIYDQTETPVYRAQLLEAVAEPTRLQILNLLEQGEFCVCELQAILALNEPTVSRHLARLRFAGLVLSRRNGSRVMYRLSQAGSPTVTILQRFLCDVSREEPSLQRDLRAVGDLVRGSRRAWR
jgi:ArsR family transcriptional regulator, arsenate/arsenite/antimonite-responsive transcriptional repressor